jgi:hypothetical protein
MTNAAHCENILSESIYLRLLRLVSPKNLCYIHDVILYSLIKFIQTGKNMSRTYDDREEKL